MTNTTYRPNYEDTIQVLVGPDKRPFTIHEAMIRAKSPFFTAALNHDWTETQTKTVSLGETSPEIFATNAHWVYTSQLDMDMLVKPGEEISHLDLAKLWIFADMILDAVLCDRVTEAIIDRAINRNRYPSASSLNHIYSNTTACSKLRTLSIDICTALTTEEGFAREQGNLPKEFMYELSRRYLFGESRPNRKSLEEKEKVCERYHVHKEGESC